MKVNAVNSGNYRDEYPTPQSIWEPLGKFDLDPFASREFPLIGLKNYFKEDDGFSLPWIGFVWCNPPFSRKDEAIDLMIAHNNGILLLPTSTDTRWFGRMINASGYMFAFTGRKKYGSSKDALFETALYPFGDEALRRIKAAISKGSFCGNLLKLERV